MTKRLSRLHQIAQFVNPNGGCSEDYRAWIIFARQLERELSAARAALAAARPSDEAHQFAFNLIHLDHHLGRQEMRVMARELIRLDRIAKGEG